MSETVVVGSPAPELIVRAEDAFAIATSYKIDCIEMREAASQGLKRVKFLVRELDEQRKEITAPLDLAKKRVMDLFRKPAEFLANAEVILKTACLTWDREQGQIRREAETAAARIADAERKLLAYEAQKQTDAGNIETAHAIAEAAQMVAPIPVAIERAQVTGESTRDVWRAEITDLKALARAVADGVASPECLLPNMPALNGQARALKSSLTIPGVKAVAERVLASRVGTG